MSNVQNCISKIQIWSVAMATNKTKDICQKQKKMHYKGLLYFAKRYGFLTWLTGLKSLNKIKCYSRYLFIVQLQVESIQKLLFQVPLITL